MEAQHAMAANSELAEHILETSTTWQDINYNDNRWILKPFASQGGAGIRRYEGGRVPQGFYLQKDANKYREFRAHVGLWLENPVFTIQEKKPKPELWADIFGDPDLYTWPLDDEDERNGLPLTWNIESGFYFRRSTTPENRADKVVIYPLFRRIEEVAVRAVKALGYQFGAVDILMDESRHLWVTEVNSHPAIKNDESKRIYLLALEPLKEMSKIDIYNVIQQATTRITRRTFVRGEGFI